MTEAKSTSAKLTTALVIVPNIFSTSRDMDTLERKHEEAVGLSEAIDLTIFASKIVNISRLRPATLFGSGKTQEIAAIVRENKVDVAIIDHQLTPVQQRNLEIEWHCKVLDRTALILEIFGARARTHEGRLQVELAALQYQRSRLVRSWTHLERQRGGFGFLGGPGESQLEIDRRLTDQRISKLTSEIGNIQKTRTLQRVARQRDALPTVALVGYTNAGKSTLFNRLTNADVVAQDMLFATLDPTMRGVTLPSGAKIILCDTVGFISDLPTELVASFKATLEEIIEADVVLHIHDAASAEMSRQSRTVQKILIEIVGEMPSKVYDVLNKIDLIDDETLEFGGNGIEISATTGMGCDHLIELLDREFLSRRQVFTYSIPSSDGAALAWLYSNGEVINNSPQDMSNIVKVALQSPDAGRFEQRFQLVPLS
ncbi:MAG: GTPase HflX [Rickettsiales bacterium]|nr:GTPase HflX [Rickettsiales bacterium]